MAKLAAGIIGTGEVAETHARVMAADGRARLAHVFNRTPERAERFAVRHGATVLASAEALIDASDVVLICSPQHTHAAYAQAALEAGKAVLCEKPGAISVAQARQLADRAERSGAVYQAGFNRRFAPVYREVGRLLASGELRATSFQIKINRGELEAPAWVSDRSLSGGFLFETTIHLLDMAQHLFGDVRIVAARGTQRVYDQPDNFSVLLESAEGVHGVLTSAGHATWAYPFERVEVYGPQQTVATVELDAVVRTVGLRRETVAKRFTTLPSEQRWGFAGQMETFLDRVTGRSPSYDRFATSRDVVAAAALAETLYAHANGGAEG